MSLIDVPTPAELNALRDQPPSIDREGIEAAMERLCEGWPSVDWHVRWFDDAVSALRYLAQRGNEVAESPEPPYRRFFSLEYDEVCGQLNWSDIGAYILGDVAPWETLETWYIIDQQVLSDAFSRAIAGLAEEHAPESIQLDLASYWQLVDSAIHIHVEAMIAVKSGYDEGGLILHWRDLVDAYQAGLWLYWIVGHAIVVVPRPTLHARDGQLHNETGPAVAWPEGGHRWFLEGVEVTEQIVCAPETLTVDEILGERDVEVRRLMIERFGVERLLHEADAQTVHATPDGTLYRVPFPYGARDHEEALVVVQVICPSTQRRFLLRVPPWLRRVREAIAWTFRLPSEQYGPIRET